MSGPIVYGKPQGEGEYWREVYCAICNHIPVIFSMDEDFETYAEIQALIPLSLLKMGDGGKLIDRIMMTCPKCEKRLMKKIEDEIKKRFPPP